MEEYFYLLLEQKLARSSGPEETFLLRDLMSRLDSELKIQTYWKLLDWLADNGMANGVEMFVDKLAGLVAGRLLRLRGEWAKVCTAYADFLELTKRPEKKWMKWSLKSSEPYYLFCSQLSLEILHALPNITVLGGEMSGDMFGIGATMILKPQMITVIKKDADNPFDHTAQIESFLAACDHDKSRVVVYEKRGKVLWAKLLESARFGGLFGLLAPKVVSKAIAPDEVLILPKLAQIMQKRGKIYWVTSLDTGTKFLKERTLWEVENPRIKIRHRWGVCSFDFATRAKALEKWMRAKGLPVDALRDAHEKGPEKKVLILWSRFTGKKGEIHVEHDTSFRGTQQLALRALNSGGVDYVIITGDKPVAHDNLTLKPNQSLQQAKQARLRKFTKICNEINQARGTECCFDLTGFWEDSETKKWTGGARTGQFLLFEYLHRVGDARHLGMRSGNLEALALLGYWVRYMEETDSWGGERMEQWHGRGLGYERIVISAPPTRTGKYLIARIPKHTVFAPPKNIKWLLERRGLDLSEGDWWSQDKPQEIARGGQIVRKTKTGTELVDVDAFTKGFSQMDLIEIASQLRRKNFHRRIDTLLPNRK